MSETLNYQYWFMDLVTDEKKEYGYFSAVNMNGLFRWDFAANRVTYLGEFAGERFQNELYHTGVLKGEKLYFPPRMAKHMAVYDRLQKRIFMKELYPMNPFCNVEFRASHYGYTVLPGTGDEIYLIYRESPLCVKWNTASGACSYLTCADTGKEIILAKDYVIDDHKCYLPATNCNVVLELDMESDTLSTHTVGTKKEWGFGSITKDEDGIWLFRIDCFSLVYWSPSTGKIRVFDKFKDKEVRNYSNYLKLALRGKNLFLIPGLTLDERTDTIICFDPSRGTTEEYDVFREYRKFRKWPIFRIGSFYGYSMFSGTDDIYKASSIIFICLNLEDLSVREFRVPLPFNVSEEVMSERIEWYQENVKFEQILRSRQPFYEQKDFEVEKYLAHVRSLKTIEKENNLSFDCGKTIYEEMKRELFLRE